MFCTSDVRVHRVRASCTYDVGRRRRRRRRAVAACAWATASGFTARSSPALSSSFGLRVTSRRRRQFALSLSLSLPPRSPPPLTLSLSHSPPPPPPPPRRRRRYSFFFFHTVRLSFYRRNSERTRRPSSSSSLRRRRRRRPVQSVQIRATLGFYARARCSPSSWVDECARTAPHVRRRFGRRRVAVATAAASTQHKHLQGYRGHVVRLDMLKDIHSPGLVADPEDGGNGACCAGCGRSIDDRFYLSAVDMCWHIGCLQCAECKQPLDTELTCYSRHGNIYCKQDYYRLFSIKRCARCQAGIGACDLVMRANELVYHVECFACYACGAVLCKGDYYGVRDGAVFCRPDYERLRRGDVCGELEPMCSPPRAAGHHWPSAHKGRPRKKRNGGGGGVQLSSPMTAAECNNGLAELNVLRIPQSTLEVMQATDLSSSMESLTYETSSLSSPTNSSTMGTGGMSQQQQQQTRTKRMRTSFKHHQLRTMKSYFNINQNPDAKDLKQLAQKTGLSKRVLQVWFQNARAKWRRNIMRQENSQMVTSSMSGQNQSAPSDPDLIRGHTQSSQGLNFVDLF